MKNFSKFRKFLLALAILFIVTLGSVIAQPADPGGSEGDPVGGTNAPLDGGAILMLIAGVAYGVKKLKDNKK